uniref:Uncharacterized protein LOC114330187 n=1 Tax=Diabrotica virgifera virgifera TaxID=50390 RepID=A0A6P7FGY6_DIAVI
MVVGVAYFLFLVILMGVANTEAVVTNDDIRAAILQLVNIVRATDDKIERHEYRERILGEQLKKGMINIDKRIKMLDPLKGTVGRMDERLTALETMLMQTNEKEKLQLQSTFEAVIQKNLPVIMEKMKNEIISKISAHVPPSQISPAVISKEDLESTKKEIMNKIYIVTNSIGKIENEIVKINADNKQIEDLHKKSLENLENLKIYFNNNQELFTKIDKKLDNCNSKINNQENEEWKFNVTTAINGQKSDVKTILADAKLLQNKIDQLSQKYDLAIDQNTALQKEDHSKSELINYINKTHEDTIMKLDNLSKITVSLGENFRNNYDTIRNEIKDLNRLDQVMINTTYGFIDTKQKNSKESDVKKILADAKLLQNKIDQLSQKYEIAIDQNFTLQKQDHSKSELINYINKTHEDTIMKLDHLSEITVTLGESFRNNYDKIRNEIKDLNRLDQVMINTTDGDIDSKSSTLRKVEFGMHQILAEVSKYSKECAISIIQESVSNRLDTFKTSILDPETGALANATSKIKEHIQQVLHKIGIMHQQMRSHAVALNQLDNCKVIEIRHLLRSKYDTDEETQSFEQGPHL